MTTSAKTYTKKKEKKNGQTEPQDKWKKKSCTDKSHKEAYTYTLTKREKGTKEYFQGLSQEDSASEDWSISPGLASSGPKAQKISTHPPIGNSGLKTTQPTVLGPIQGSLSNLLIIICPCAKTGHREKMY